MRWPFSVRRAAKYRASSSVGAPRRRDETKGSFGIGEEYLDRGRALAEPVLHALERAEERDDVLDDLRTDHLGHRAYERLHRNAGHAQIRTRRHHQELEDAVVEQPYDSLRRVEEVERVSGRWRVDDNQVEPAPIVELVQLLHRHVLLRAPERAGDVAVERVGKDPLRLFG